MGNTLTINTDASFCPKTKAAGWAFIIVCDEFRIKKHGIFTKRVPKNAEEAEIMCIGNALNIIAQDKDQVYVRFFRVNSDCTGAMDAVQEPRDNELDIQVNKLWLKCIDKLRSKKNSFRYVKAHSGVDDKRSKANAWCDYWAKREMQDLRNEILNQ